MEHFLHADSRGRAVRRAQHFHPGGEWRPDLRIGRAEEQQARRTRAGREMRDTAVVPEEVVHLAVDRPQIDETASGEVGVGQPRLVEESAKPADDALFGFAAGDEKMGFPVSRMEPGEDLDPGFEAPVLFRTAAPGCKAMSAPSPSSRFDGKTGGSDGAG